MRLSSLNLSKNGIENDAFSDQNGDSDQKFVLFLIILDNQITMTYNLSLWFFLFYILRSRIGVRVRVRVRVRVQARVTVRFWVRAMLRFCFKNDLIIKTDYYLKKIRS